MKATFIKLLLAVSVVCLASACSPGEDSAEQSSSTVFDDQIEAHEKAKEVEKQLQEAADKRRQQLEDSGG